MRPMVPFFAALLAATLAPVSVGAAPQALVVASAGDVPLACEIGVCAADISTFCLQPERDTPPPGTPYTVHNTLRGETISLVGRGVHGGMVSIAPSDAISMVAARGNTAVRVAVPEALLRRHGLQGARLRIQGHPVLVPLAEEGDREPQTTAELARVGDSLRPLALAVMERDRTALGAARIIERAINGLSRTLLADRATYGNAWRDAAETGEPLRADARNRAGDAYGACGARFAAAPESETDARSCLGGWHGSLMNGVGSRYRDALKLGS